MDVCTTSHGPAAAVAVAAVRRYSLYEVALQTDSQPSSALPVAAASTVVKDAGVSPLAVLAVMA